MSRFWEQLGFGWPRGSSGGGTVGSENERAREHAGAESARAALRNDDRLRGSARRRLFDEQRRRMSLNSSTGGVPRSQGANAALDGDAEGRPTTPGETRARGVRHETASVGADDNQMSILGSSGNAVLERRLRKLSTLCWNTTRVSSQFLFPFQLYWPMQFY